MIVVGLNRALKQGYTDQPYTESIEAVRLVANKADETPWTWFPGHDDEGSIEHLPGHIDKAVKEAYRTCSQRNYISSILMARTAIEAAAKDNGIKDGKLVHKINEMQKQSLIREDVAAVAHSIRLFGNEMAHGDINVEVTMQDATEVLVLLAGIMNEIYGRVARLASITGRIKERDARAKAMKDEKE